MDTQTLIETIGDIKSDNDRTRRIISNIYSIYSRPFDRLTVLSMFHEPVNLIWKEERDMLNNGRAKKHYFSLDGKDYKPKTIADFISIIDSLGNHKLTPKFTENKSEAALLWNRHRNNN